MATILGVIQLFRNILAKSIVIDGRLFVVRSGADANATNMAQLVTDALDGQTEGQKYPCAVLLPTHKTTVNNDKGYSNLSFQMYFLTLDERTGDGEIKSRDQETNMSTHTKEMDWQDMDKVATEFRKKLRDITRLPPVTKEVREVPGSHDTMYYITEKGNDRINGVKLEFELQVADDNCQFADYPDDTTIDIPDFSPHPLHTH